MLLAQAAVGQMSDLEKLVAMFGAPATIMFIVIFALVRGWLCLGREVHFMEQLYRTELEKNKRLEEALDQALQLVKPPTPPERSNAG